MNHRFVTFVATTAIFLAVVVSLPGDRFAEASHPTQFQACGVGGYDLDCDGFDWNGPTEGWTGTRGDIACAATSTANDEGGYDAPPVGQYGDAWPVDMNDDGRVSLWDVGGITARWGTSGRGDINGDGATSVGDLAVMVYHHWGQNCLLGREGQSQHTSYTFATLVSVDSGGPTTVYTITWYGWGGSLSSSGSDGLYYFVDGHREVGYINQAGPTGWGAFLELVPGANAVYEGVFGQESMKDFPDGNSNHCTYFIPADNKIACWNQDVRDSFWGGNFFGFVAMATTNPFVNILGCAVVKYPFSGSSNPGTCAPGGE